MGAWGHKTFEDDSALDLIDDLIDSDNPLDEIEQSLSKVQEGEYLEYDDGQVVSVALAILDYALHDDAPDRNEIEEDVEGLRAWLDTLDRARLRALLPAALRGADVLVSPQSELAELWAENEELFPQWRDLILARRDRLARL